MKLIDLHKEWCKSGKIKDREFTNNGDGGLCNAIPDQYLNDLKLFDPQTGQVYWEQANDSSLHRVIYGYNLFRQSVVLLICAMNNEL
jgi:hypothetical protein